MFPVLALLGLLCPGCEPTPALTQDLNSMACAYTSIPTLISTQRRVKSKGCRYNSRTRNPTNYLCIFLQNQIYCLLTWVYLMQALSPLKLLQSVTVWVRPHRNGAMSARKFLNTLDNLELKQHVTGSTHNLGNTLGPEG